VINYPAINQNAIPTKEGYVLSLDLFKSLSAKRKMIGQEAKFKIITLNDQDFTTVNIQTFLQDVENPNFNRFLADAVRYMEAHAPNELLQQAFPYLRALNEKTAAYENVLDLPPFSVSFPDDGEMLLEWNFEHFKIGLSFETDPEESGWYIVHDGTVRKMTGWAYLNSQSLTELVNTILSQVVENAP
jgi:hypothetical protein